MVSCTQIHIWLNMSGYSNSNRHRMLKPESPKKYSVEKHGNGYAIYSGRDNEHHGLNLAFISEISKGAEHIPKMIEAALNSLHDS